MFPIVSCDLHPQTAGRWSHRCLKGRVIVLWLRDISETETYPKPTTRSKKLEAIAIRLEAIATKEQEATSSSWH